MRCTQAGYTYLEAILVVLEASVVMNEAVQFLHLLIISLGLKQKHRQCHVRTIQVRQVGRLAFLQHFSKRAYGVHLSSTRLLFLTVTLQGASLQY